MPDNFGKQYVLPYEIEDDVTEISNREKLINLLSSDLNFHNQKSEFLSHNYHSFPAKFPPQLPRKFILELIQKNDVILDPMMGSGTTILEGFLLGRKAIGFDIDPLAVLILRVKTLPMNLKTVARQARSILKEAKEKIESDVQKLEDLLHKRWDIKTKEFVDNWFSHKTQLELIALQSAIESFDDKAIKSFFKLMFSSLIITKSGGVSFALDLAHTRPHKAKIVYTSKGEKLLGQDLIGVHPPRLKLHTKTLRSVIDEFEKKCDQSLNSWREARLGKFKPVIDYGDAQNLPLNHQSVDLIVTSPPYASNAIDYMRAHKFSLVWFGYSIEELSQKRKEYIGGELSNNIIYEELPDYTEKVVKNISSLDSKKGKTLHRYYSEMTRTLREMFRVLKPGKAAIVVVGNSIMRGKDTETQNCLSDIGKAIGFEIPKIGTRKLDRNKRMLPAGETINKDSQIQKRMHEEYVIGFIKPES